MHLRPLRTNARRLGHRPVLLAKSPGRPEECVAVPEQPERRWSRQKLHPRQNLTLRRLRLNLSEPRMVFPRMTIGFPQSTMAG